MKVPEDALVAFGSNLGNSLEICMESIRALSRHPRIHLCQVSSFYRTQPVGCRDQGWFINGVVRVETGLAPRALLAELLRIESLFGRERRNRWGPRTLDLDLLFYGDHVIESPALVLPHAAICERRFVLEPLVEIQPERVHPVSLKSVSQLLKELNLTAHEQQIERMDGICFAP